MHQHQNYDNQQAGMHVNGYAATPGVASMQAQFQSYHQPPYGQKSSNNLPPGAYVNPNFAPLPLSRGNGQRQSQQFQPMHASTLPVSGSPPRTLAGHKRKLEALRPPSQERKKPGPQTAPAVPSFGAPLLPPKPVQGVPQKPPSKQRNTPNALGLTPGDAEPHYSSSDDEADDKDVDEEALHAELGAKLTFEHNGMVMSLNSAKDLAAWQEERRKKWPTRARMAEREAEKRRVGEERRRLLASAAVLEDDSAVLKKGNRRDSGKTRRFSQTTPGTEAPVVVNEVIMTNAEPESKVGRARRELAEQTTKLEALRREVATGEALLARLKASQETEGVISTKDAISEYGLAAIVDDQDNADAGDVSDISSEVLSESSVVSSNSSPQPESDDDGPPEESTTKAAATSNGSSQRLACKYFAASGHCRDGDACRFRHELAPGSAAVQQQRRPERQPAGAPKLDKPGPSEKKSIYQRLMEQQREEEDRLALRVIKHLGKAGFFSSQPAEHGSSS